ncbi:hypothetical protein KIPB_008258, partial [Kipferlia bialata]|eukprot:g8258.t1
MSKPVEFEGCDPLAAVLPSAAEEYTLVRAKFLLPMNEDEGFDCRISDGYLLTKGDSIVEVGKYSAAIGNRLVSEHTSLKIVGLDDAKAERFDNDPVPRLKGILMPGFVKAHGHDHESPLIGLNKVCIYIYIYIYIYVCVCVCVC